MVNDVLLRTRNDTRVVRKIVDIIEKHGSPVFVLIGDLGAGKTHLVKGVLTKLGYSGGASPTFVLLRFYKTPKGGIAHYDLYRVLKENLGTDATQLIESTALLDYIGRYPTFIEWGEILLPFLETILETGLYIINIQILNDETRLYEIKRIK